MYNFQRRNVIQFKIFKMLINNIQKNIEILFMTLKLKTRLEIIV